MDDNISTGTYNSKKRNERAKIIKEDNSLQKTVIKKGNGLLSDLRQIVSGFCYIGGKLYYAKEIKEKPYQGCFGGDSAAGLAINQAFYSMIAHTPAIVGRQTVNGKDCCIFSKIDIDTQIEQKSLKKRNKSDKSVFTLIQIQTLLYGLFDRMQNMVSTKDKYGTDQVCGYDLDRGPEGFLAFNFYPPIERSELDKSESPGLDFLKAKRSRLKIVKDECKKLANFDYDEFLHRCIMNFKILGIENYKETWDTLMQFFTCAQEYKHELCDNFFTDKFVAQEEKKEIQGCCLKKLKEYILYGDKYKAPKLVQKAIQTDWKNFDNFFKNIIGKKIEKIIEDYGDNYRKNHPKSNVNNCQSKINFNTFHACARGISFY